MQQHPELSLSVELSDRSVDLIEEGYDLAIRTGPTDETGLVAWHLMPLDYVLCAAPSYLARHGEPHIPADLNGHHCITGTEAAGATWTFSGPDGDAEMAIYGRLQVNNAMLRRRPTMTASRRAALGAML